MSRIVDIDDFIALSKFKSQSSSIKFLYNVLLIITNLFMNTLN